MRNLVRLLALSVLIMPSAGNARAGDDHLVVDVPSIQLPQLARGGSAVSWVQRGRASALWRAAAPTWQPLRVADWSSSKMMYQMSPEGAHFLILSVDKSGMPVLTLHSVDESDSAPLVVTLPGRVAGFGEQARREGFEVVSQAQDGTLTENVLDFRSGAIKQMASLGGGYSIGFDPGGRVGLVQTVRGKWATPTATDIGGVPVASVPDRPLMVTEDRTAAYFSGVDKDGFAVVRKADVLSGEVAVVATAPRADVTARAFSPITGELDAYMYDPGRPEWVGLTRRMRLALSHLSNRLPGQIRIVGRSDDDATWLIETQDVTSAPAYYVFTPETRKLRTVVVQGNHIDNDHAESMATVLTSPDGEAFQAWAVPPDPATCDSAKQRCPFVVNVHGGPHHRDGAQYDAEAAWLRSQGYWVLRVNFRGSTGFGDAFANASDGEWGGGAIADIQTATSWLKTQPGVSSERGAAMGNSYGGFASIALATFYPGSVVCAASLNGGGDLRSFALILPQRRPDMADDIHREVGDVTKPADLARILAQSPAEHVGASSVPFLVEYGALDKVSVPEQSTGFIDQLARGGRPYVSVEYSDQGHGLSSAAAQVFHYRTLRKWLTRCTGMPSADLPPTSGADVVVTGDPSLLRDMGLH